MTLPWEKPPLEDIVAALQRDFAYAVQNTAVTVHTENSAFALTVNTPRGQLVPPGKIKFTDGTVLELRDLGMCQPGVPSMTVPELVAKIWEIANELGLVVE